ncbi:helix-turn-helix domain-containing protein [Corynebacterium sp. ACRQP]|uniref:helix-turn-helix domain-containing protein n=1 Tax=Corynebacterium sp. ACRQP TaxID=2918195 RepID=UPI001EF64694|nr:helix-turn-helix domain-containing protein [Corynebacterium sp. ACRQP]MCG7235254.1 helix-turn-helix domain-containing protein [Corynebacterium sp. ACRQP]
MMRPITVTENSVIIAAGDARELAETIFAAADLANRHGARINPRALALATDLVSAAGTTEPEYIEIEDHLEHEQIDTATTAALLGCTDRNVRALAARKLLPGVKNGGQWRFNREDVEVYRDHRR